MKKKPISRRADLNAVLQRGLEGSDLVAYQHSRLLEVCAHAAKEVLFYKDRLSAFSSRRTFSTQLWQTIPILSRRKLAENSDAILAKSIPTMAGSSRSTFTSGSSGQPLFTLNRYFREWRSIWPAPGHHTRNALLCQYPDLLPQAPLTGAAIRLSIVHLSIVTILLST